jgi:hypothetical protein
VATRLRGAVSRRARRFRRTRRFVARPLLIRKLLDPRITGRRLPLVRITAETSTFAAQRGFRQRTLNEA